MVLRIRRGKSMVVDPEDPNSKSAGSFFMNPRVDSDTLEKVRKGLETLGMTEDELPCWTVPDGRTKLAAAWLIERSGMPRGFGAGPVGLSEKHTLAIVNRGGATAADVVSFARTVRNRVRETFGVSLTPEPGFVGFGESVSELLA